MPIVVVIFAMGAAMGQFGCYWYDGALRLSFSKLSNETGVEIPSEIDVLFNILRATSLFHIFYGFCLLLVFHLSLIFMIQSSMREFNGELSAERSQFLVFTLNQLSQGIFSGVGNVQMEA